MKFTERCSIRFSTITYSFHVENIPRTSQIKAEDKESTIQSDMSITLSYWDKIVADLFQYTKHFV